MKNLVQLEPKMSMRGNEVKDIWMDCGWAPQAMLIRVSTFPVDSREFSGLSSVTFTFFIMKNFKPKSR